MGGTEIRRSRGVGSMAPLLDLDRCWVSSASRLTTITLAASRVDPSTTDRPGLLVACIAAEGRITLLPPSSAAILADKELTSASPFVDALPRWLGATGSGRGCWGPNAESPFPVEDTAGPGGCRAIATIRSDVPGSTTTTPGVQVNC